MKLSFSPKPWLSPFVTIAFLVVSATGVMLFFHIKNRPIFVLHEWFGWGFVAAGVVHLLLNARALLSYLRLRSGLCSVLAAFVLAVLLYAWSLNRLEPQHRWPDAASDSSRPSVPAK